MKRSHGVPTSSDFIINAFGTKLNANHNNNTKFNLHFIYIYMYHNTRILYSHHITLHPCWTRINSGRRDCPLNTMRIRKMHIHFERSDAEIKIKMTSMQISGQATHQTHQTHVSRARCISNHRDSAQRSAVFRVFLLVCVLKTVVIWSRHCVASHHSPAVAAQGMFLNAV